MHSCCGMLMESHIWLKLYIAKTLHSCTAGCKLNFAFPIIDVLLLKMESLIFTVPLHTYCMVRMHVINLKDAVCCLELFVVVQWSDVTVVGECCCNSWKSQCWSPAFPDWCSIENNHRPASGAVSWWDQEIGTVSCWMCQGERRWAVNWWGNWSSLLFQQHYLHFRCNFSFVYSYYCSSRCCYISNSHWTNY